MIANHLSQRESRCLVTKKESSSFYHYAKITNNSYITCSPLPVPLLIITLIFLFLQLTSCVRRETVNNSLLIAVSIPPQQWFVSQIAGENVQVTALAGSGTNPHNFEPAPRQIQSLSSANAWILSGAEFETGLLPKVKNLFPNLLIVDGTKGVRFRTLEEHDHDRLHEYNVNGDTSALHLDRHTWLGREPAKILAAHVMDTLVLIDGENEKFYYERHENIIQLIDSEFNKLKITLAPLNGKKVFVYHPSFGYFLDEFGIYQEAVETGGKEPTPRQLNSLISEINLEQPAAVFVQTQFPVNAARTVAASVGAELIELDPLAQDWLENIRQMGQALIKAIP